jgi:Domain of unknown function (DUF4158)
VSIDPIAPQAASRHIYPKLAQRLTSANLHRLFRPSYEERRWVPTIARTPSSQVALLAQLKIFQAVGRFLPVTKSSRLDDDPVRGFFRSRTVSPPSDRNTTC